MVWTMRRMLKCSQSRGLKPLLNRLAKTKSNAEFLGTLTKVPSPSWSPVSRRRLAIWRAQANPAARRDLGAFPAMGRLGPIRKRSLQRPC